MTAQTERLIKPISNTNACHKTNIFKNFCAPSKVFSKIVFLFKEFTRPENWKKFRICNNLRAARITVIRTDRCKDETMQTYSMSVGEHSRRPTWCSVWSHVLHRRSICLRCRWVGIRHWRCHVRVAGHQLKQATTQL